MSNSNYSISQIGKCGNFCSFEVTEGENTFTCNVAYPIKDERGMVDISWDDEAPEAWEQVEQELCCWVWKESKYEVEGSTSIPKL